MQHKGPRWIGTVAAGLSAGLVLAAADPEVFLTHDPLRAFVYREYPLGDDYFIRGNEDTIVFRCPLTKAQAKFEGVALSEISIWGNRTGPWDIFRKTSDGAFAYVETRHFSDTSCMEFCRTKEYLASGQCTWNRGWPRK